MHVKRLQVKAFLLDWPQIQNRICQSSVWGKICQFLKNNFVSNILDSLLNCATILEGNGTKVLI